MILVNGMIQLEQTGPPGNIGDSAAESGRLSTLRTFLKQPNSDIKLDNFVQADGAVIRHPDSPWGASDTSSDQVIPLLPMLDKSTQSLVIRRIRNDGYRTGNSQLISPLLYAQLKRAEGSRLQLVWDLAILLQALLFYSPIRWNDATGSLTSSAGSTADYLNWLNTILFSKMKNPTPTSKLAKKLVPNSKILAAVSSYYAPEPDSAWLIDLYKKALEKIDGTHT
jgi:hypothetical protein